MRSICCCAHLLDSLTDKLRADEEADRQELAVSAASLRKAGVQAKLQQTLEQLADQTTSQLQDSGPSSMVSDASDFAGVRHFGMEY